MIQLPLVMLNILAEECHLNIVKMEKLLVISSIVVLFIMFSTFL